MADYSTAFDGVNMPYSLDAEQSVLGAVLLDPECMSDETVAQLTPEYFYLPQNRAIFSAMFQMNSFNRPIDSVTLLEELRSNGDYEAAGGKEYLIQIAQLVPSVKNVKAYAETVIEKYYIRALIQAGRDTVTEAQEEKNPASMLIDAAEQRLYNIRQNKDTTSLVKLKDILAVQTLQRLNDLSDPEKRKELAGIPTGFSDIDRKIGGLHKANLIIIGARPAMGKTSFILNIAENIAVNAGKKVAFFSLEMSGDELAGRLLSSRSSVDSKKIHDGYLNSDEWDMIITATADLYKAELYVDDKAALTVNDIKTKLRRNRPDVVFIDYLQLIAPSSKSENRVQQVSQITRELKIMAKELDIPVIVCSQLSRESEHRNSSSHKPQLSDLRESGSIEQDADIVMFLYREDYYNNGSEESNNSAECIIAKNRHGETGIAPLYWNGRLTRFMTAEREDYDS